MQVQGSRSGKVLGIGELLANVCSASAPLDWSYHKYLTQLSVGIRGLPVAADKAQVEAEER